MAQTNLFEKTIKAYLDERASQDPLFAEKYANKDKNIVDCCTYIVSWVRASNRQGFDDAEIYGQAVHYYDEANIEIGKPVKCNVVVNHSTELTAEDIAKAKKNAMDEIERQMRVDMKVDRLKRSKPKAQDSNLTLF